MFSLIEEFLQSNGDDHVYYYMNWKRLDPHIFFPKFDYKPSSSAFYLSQNKNPVTLAVLPPDLLSVQCIRDKFSILRETFSVHFAVSLQDENVIPVKFSPHLNHVPLVLWKLPENFTFPDLLPFCTTRHM